MRSDADPERDEYATYRAPPDQHFKTVFDAFMTAIAISDQSALGVCIVISINITAGTIQFDGERALQTQKQKLSPPLHPLRPRLPYVTACAVRTDIRATTAPPGAILLLFSPNVKQGL